MTDTRRPRWPRRGRALTDAEEKAVLDAQRRVDAAFAERDEAVKARNELFRELHGDGVMPATLGRAAVTDEHPDGLHRTVVAKYVSPGEGD